MTKRIATTGRVLGIVALLGAGACAALGTGSEDATLLGIGDPCIVGDEAFAEFSGFSEHEVNIEDGGSCGTSSVCLVHDFRGRATCPSGQVSADEGGCLTTEGEPVVVPVQPQLPDRPADVGMVCSCRCDGPDPDASYCQCPSGMRCEELIRSGSGRDDRYTGSYCIY